MAVTNVFNNTAKITKKAMNVLRNNLVLVPRVNRTYEQEFNKGEGKIGDTVNVRIPGLGGDVVTGKVAAPASFGDTYVPLTLVQKNVSLRFSSKELKLNAEDSPEFERSVLGPQMAKLINTVESDGFALYSGFNGSEGTPGTAPTDLSPFLNAKAALADAAAPMDDQIFAFLNPWSEASMVNGLKGLFQDSTEIAMQYKKGVMGRSAGMSFLTSQNVPTHSTGTWSGTPVINDPGAALVSGGTTLPIDGFGGATDSFKKGDVLTVAGVYSVNPVSKLSTGKLMEFTVTADYAATGNAMAALPISPAFVTTGQFQNVTALPLDGAVVQIFGHATSYSGKVSPANLVLHRDAIGFAMVDLPILDPGRQTRVRDNDLGLSLRKTEWYDGVNDELLIRLDVMYAWGILRQGFGQRVQG